MRVRSTLRMALMLVLGLQLAAFALVAEAQETRYWGVVAGVADYAYIGDLTYTDDDAVEFAAALTGYPEWSGLNQVEVLIDSDASKQGLYDAIERMGEKANADTEDHDVCVFFFSGHGTQVADTLGEEADFYDEAICTWDTRSYWRYMRGVVTDDELGDWLTTMLPANADIICIFDTCFSGGLAKGVEGARVKSFHNRYLSSRARLRKPFGQGLLQRLAARGAAAGAKDISGTNVVVLMASEEGGLSYEDSFLENGVFTYYLVEGLTSQSAVADANSNDQLSAEEGFAYAEPLTEAHVWPWQNATLYDGNPAVEVTLMLLGLDRPPSVNVTAPTDGATVSGTMDITAVATDDVGIQRVDFYVDGFLVGSDSVADPGDVYSITSWDSTTADEGERTITATAVDTVDHETSVSITVNVDNYNAPQVSITGPGAASEVFSIEASASAAAGLAIVRVEFYVDAAHLGDDTSAPYSFGWDTTEDSNGWYTLQVVAVDDKGQSAEDSISVEVNNVVSGVSATVESVSVSLRQRRSLYYAIATVTVTDSRGRPISRARVSGYWSLATSDVDAGLTGDAGVFTCRSDRVRRPRSGTVFRFTVRHVSWAGGAWDGIEQSGEVVVP